MTTSTSSSSKAPEELVELGRISGAYGIKGWVRIRPYSSDGATLLETRYWWLKPPVSAAGTGGFSSARRVKVTSSRPHGGVVVARLDDMVDRNQAEELKGWTVWVARADFPVLDKDEYYWVDLIGCRLYGDDGGQQALIGEVVGVMDNGAHGVLRVVRADVGTDGTIQYLLDSKGRQRETLVPFVAEHVHTVDLDSRQLISNWPVDL